MASRNSSERCVAIRISLKGFFSLELVQQDQQLQSWFAQYQWSTPIAKQPAARKRRRVGGLPPVDSPSVS
jgi:hypothetical protein